MAIVHADRGKCRGWANCVAGADDVFDIDDDGVVTLLRGAIGPDEVGRVGEVARRCPEAALAVDGA
ncbi:ferredoxin [Amycolatopsis sp. NPDC050768]|uniref:ferredoxin n=1 Tax=Amycolatopsis sp. NPDC050768 TaxID=3154839 RepID=UPI0033D03B31